MKEKTRNILTIVMTVVELLILVLVGALDELRSFMELQGWVVDLLSFVTPGPLLYLLNYYCLVPVIYYVSRFVWHSTGHYSYYEKSYGDFIAKAVNWLVSCKVHWGVVAQADVMQNANTCEGLLALRVSGKHKEKAGIYKKAFQSVLQNATETGLPSKSLQKSTVVCTSMLLELIARERSESMGMIQDFSVYDQMAEHLWNARNERFGWGVYTVRAEDDDCSLCNTYWALRALRNYPVGKSEAFCEYIQDIYEYSHKGRFGFCAGDVNRLVTTAMFLSLYYTLTPELQQQIGRAYDPKGAVDFVFETFVMQNRQLEVETLSGINPDGHAGAVKAPWNHISTGYAIEALLLAYKNGDLGVIRADVLFNRINTILKKDIKCVDEDSCYYIPQGMEHNKTGVFTFPTSYLVQGLSRIFDRKSRRNAGKQKVIP